MSVQPLFPSRGRGNRSPSAEADEDSPDERDSGRASPPIQYDERRRTSELRHLQKRDGQSPNTRTVVFDAKKKSGDGSSRTLFSKEEVSQPVSSSRRGPSSLSRVMKGADPTSEDDSTMSETWSVSSSPRSSSALGSAVTDWDVTAPKTRLTIHVPKGKKMVVDVPATATVVQVIKYTLLSFNREVVKAGEELLKEDPDFYCLRLVDETGKPDDDFPPLNPIRQILRVKETEFALAENPKWRGARTPERLVRKRANSQSTAGRSSGSKATAGSKGKPSVPERGVGSTKVKGERSPARGAPKPPKPPIASNPKSMIITVLFPRGDYMVCQFRRDTLVMEMHQYVARRRGLPPDNWVLADEQGKKLSVESTIDALGIDRVWLIRGEAAKGNTRISAGDLASSVPKVSDSAEPESFVFTEALASQYKEWDVIKVNRHGKRQERLLGVDRDAVYNDLPRGERSGLFSSKATKRSSRPMESVIGIGLSENEPGCFWIDFRDDDSREGHKLYMYEAKTKNDAAEIVAKIRFILHMIGKR